MKPTKQQTKKTKKKKRNNIISYILNYLNDTPSFTIKR